MQMDEPPINRPSEPQAGGATGPAGDPFPSREGLREFTGALAADLPSSSLPSGPVSADEVRGLAADLAAELLHQMMQTANKVEGDEVSGYAFSTNFDCKGTTFGCSGYYQCPGLGSHSCAGTFTCGTTFRCTLVFAGLSGGGATLQRR
jgi:hypothetical protein